jgi:hypothetical protein
MPAGPSEPPQYFSVCAQPLRQFSKFIFPIAQAEQFLYGLGKPRYTRFTALLNHKPIYLNKLDYSLNI